MRRIVEASKPICRNCQLKFSRIRGIIYFDNLCCSERCFVIVGPRITPIITSAVYAPKRKPKREKVKHSKKSAFYMSQDWLELRYRVLKRYGKACMNCGKTKGEFHVDHIKPRSKHPKLALEFDNMQVLCKDCNFGKGDWDETDFRPK